jgi:hypothetical protein
MARQRQVVRLQVGPLPLLVCRAARLLLLLLVVWSLWQRLAWSDFRQRVAPWRLGWRLQAVRAR